MRDYGKLSPMFWIGETGRKLRGNTRAQLLAAYLISCPSSDMTGAFYCPVSSMAHETGLELEAPSKPLQSPFDGVNKALEDLEKVGFCYYDRENEWVFVYSMARFQIGATLKPSDNRAIGIKKYLESVPKGVRALFIRIYNEPFCLGFDVSPSEAPSEPHRSQEHEQEHEQEQKNTTTTSLSAANAELQEVASEEAESEVPPIEPELEPEPSNSNLKIPYGEIVELYNRMCVPGCVEVRILNPSRKTLIKQRANDMMKHWDGHGKNDLIECFTRLFTHVKNSDFLMGKTAKHGNHANWQCTFSWILKSENFVNILEGKYE